MIWPVALLWALLTLPATLAQCVDRHSDRQRTNLSPAKRITIDSLLSCSDLRDGLENSAYYQQNCAEPGTPGLTETQKILIGVWVPVGVLVLVLGAVGFVRNRRRENGTVKNLFSGAEAEPGAVTATELACVPGERRDTDAPGASGNTTPLPRGGTPPPPYFPGPDRVR
ncbi:uncharacterized protein BJX67DRAFT_79987 [Aspergillus lucknowensis]|uniref:Uncharacterized protein n=1 Tax=Aspergillus lucknowensis TaxID=176173 RepID=A0ABR4LSN3_9EURO